MCIWARIVAATIALSFPLLALAVPISYSFTGLLTAFNADDGSTQRTLESLSTRSITGTFSYDTDRQNVSDLTGLLRISISGDGFLFDAGYAGIEGAQSIYRDDSAALDSINFFEYYEYMLPDSLETRTTTLELFGLDLLNARTGPSDSAIDPGRFGYGLGSFWGTNWDFDQATTGLNGMFDITSLRREGVEVPEPAGAALLGAGLLLFALAQRRRTHLTRPALRTSCG
ncbi:hypothetical protein HNQ60_005308 [Povalibacter uvarum]|uniref:PEP-CTERM protein-sorting domain-containing protein n=1 Tax=Povalibacter uvarum TaxID=732238 RepID=A0A841HU02_9GAMM|nr:PEP-CTERM sorting domain-containing protein [Povalibacter uvarum]MBB6096386.1 hypothetical protein [Povalibacter uvarum]